VMLPQDMRTPSAESRIAKRPIRLHVKELLHRGLGVASMLCVAEQRRQGSMMRLSWSRLTVRVRKAKPCQPSWCERREGG
jgi:hypothetical protein